MPRVKKTKPTTETPEAADLIKSTAEELLSQLQIPATVSVETQEDNLYKVNIETEESGLLIGFHGETLSSFQIILGLMAYKKLGTWVRVVVEVGDYRAKREEQLTAMAESYAAQVLSTGQPISLPFLPPLERRIIHISLQDRTDVETFSEGEGRNRRLVIRLKV